MVTISRIRSTVLFSLMLLLLFSTAAFADKASVMITAPDSIKKGTEITIKLKVIHSGNNFIHHVSWAQISINGKELKRWDYSWTNTPESGNFERDIKYIVTEPVEISAQADCNIHGNKGLVKKQIRITE